MRAPVVMSWSGGKDSVMALQELQSSADYEVIELMTTVSEFGSLYPRTATGLLACYTMAIPFFRNSLVGDLFYTAGLFGGFALLEKLVRSLREDRQLTPG